VYAVALGLVFSAIWLLLALEPRYRDDWALENMMLVVALPILVLAQRRAPLSPASLTMIAVFLSMHELGAHYTYSEVPYDAWIRELTGTTISALTGWQRNHYDRLVHFSYGLLLTYPIRELLVRTTRLPRRLGYVLPVAILMSTSTLYEFIEWGAATVFGGDLGQAYLGTQGDVWDAQKDELLAAIGAVVAMTLASAYERTRGSDPVRAWCTRIGLH